MNAKKLLTVQDVAEIMSISKTTVRALIKRGLFKPNRVTRRVLIPVEQVDEVSRMTL